MSIRPFEGSLPNTLAVLSLAALALPSCGSEAPPAPEPIRPVRAIQVPDPAEVSRRSFTGRARAAKRSDLSFEVAGRMVERRVDVGDRVAPGQLLATLDPRDFRNELQTAKAAADRARALRDRMAEAHEVRAVSDQQLTDAETNLQAAEATVRIREKALEDSRIRAPHAGVIAAVYVENFEVVRAKQRVFRLLDASEIEMVVDIPENLIDLVRFVEEVQVRFDAFPDRELAAKIVEIGNEASATTRTFPVTLRMERPADLQIQAGMTGRASGRAALPEGRTAPPIQLPTSAVVDAGTDSAADAAVVWVLDRESGLTERRPVVVGPPTERGVPIEEGLHTGEWVAVAGAHKLREGQRVEVLDIVENEWRLPMPETRSVPAGTVTMNSLEN